MLPIIIPADIVKELVVKDKELDFVVKHYRDEIMEKIILACQVNDNQTCFIVSILQDFAIDKLKTMFEDQGYKVALLDKTLVFSW